MTSNATHDYPETLAGAYGRIDAYRAMLKDARFALVDCATEIDKQATQDHVREMIRRITAELEVTTP